MTRGFGYIPQKRKKNLIKRGREEKRRSEEEERGDQKGFVMSRRRVWVWAWVDKRFDSIHFVLLYLFKRKRNITFLGGKSFYFILH